MRDIDEIHSVKKRRYIKYPGRFIVFLVASLICIWMIINFIISLVTGQSFSILGCSTEPVRNIIVAGVDEGGYRTDLILLCQINRYDGEVNILQIPRDTKVSNHRNDKKINSAYYSGFDCMSSEIKQVTGIEVDDYVIIDFDGFIEIIDAIGGVRVDVPIRMNYTDPVQGLTIDLEPGLQRLDGEKAHMFMRFRQNNNGTGYKNGDTDRIDAQKTLYSAVAKKVLSPMGFINAPAVISAVMRNCDTNMKTTELIGAMKDVAAVGNNINIHTLPGGGRYIGGGSYFVYSKSETAALISENFVTE